MLRGLCFQRPPAKLLLVAGRNLEIDELYFKNKPGVGWNNSTSSTGPIGKFRRQDQDSFFSFFHGKQGLVPTFYYLACAHGKGNGFASLL